MKFDEWMNEWMNEWYLCNTPSSITTVGWRPHVIITRRPRRPFALGSRAMCCATAQMSSLDSWLAAAYAFASCLLPNTMSTYGIISAMASLYAWQAYAADSVNTTYLFTRRMCQLIYCSTRDHKPRSKVKVNSHRNLITFGKTVTYYIHCESQNCTV